MIKRSKKNKLKIYSPIGMRTFKTALSVFLCLVVYHLAARIQIVSGFDAFMACVAAIICMQDTMEKTLNVGFHRVYGTSIGALLGMLFLYADRFFQNEYLVIAFMSMGIIILILVCNLLKINDSIIIGCVVFLVIVLEQTAEAPYISSIRRLIDTVVGITIAILINHFVLNPDNRKNGNDVEKTTEPDGEDTPPNTPPNTP